MKIGDTVRVKIGKYAGKIGTIKSIRDWPHDERPNCYDVELPKTERWCFFQESEIEFVPPPVESRENKIEEAARIALRVWCDFDPQSSHVANAMRALERALHSK